MIFWLFISNVIYAVNALVWSNLVDIVVPVWCDIGLHMPSHMNAAVLERILPSPLHACAYASILSKSRQFAMSRRRHQREDVVKFSNLPCALAFP